MSNNNIPLKKAKKETDLLWWITDKEKPVLDHFAKGVNIDNFKQIDYDELRKGITDINYRTKDTEDRIFAYNIGTDPKYDDPNIDHIHMKTHEESIQSKQRGMGNCAVITFWQFVKLSRTTYSDFKEKYLNKVIIKGSFSDQFITALEYMISMLWNKIYNGEIKFWKQITNDYAEEEFKITAAGNDINNLYDYVNVFIQVVYYLSTGQWPGDIKFNKKKASQQAFDIYIKYMSKNTRTIPLITYMDDVYDIDNPPNNCNPEHVYIQVLDTNGKTNKILNFNSNYDMDRVNVSNSDYYYFTIYSKENQKPINNALNYGLSAFTNSSKQDKGNTSRLIFELSYSLYDTNEKGFMCNLSFSQYLRQLYLIFGRTIDGLRDYVAKNYEHVMINRANNTAWLTDITDNLNNIIVKFPNVADWKWVYGFINEKNEKKAIQGHKYFKNFAFLIIELVFGHSFKDIQLAIKTNDNKMISNLKYNLSIYMGENAKLYDFIPLPKILFNRDYHTTQQNINYKYDELFIDLVLFNVRTGEMHDFENFSGCGARDEMLNVINYKSYMPFVWFSPHAEYQHPSVPPLKITKLSKTIKSIHQLDSDKYTIH